ncbi:MFS transporter [Sporolactobacillus shoreicorticis]|uniref:MFS transporter n=1 Tax=Sporolactobacillus shoreicorticis TaxID=1923877 RepID=A0ABW5S3D0_9BACL|nr:MFS transporter [Sporolactobacillus shoreicorticis]MCO7124244.1 MFS transporter [Sporolactobacillus shoreicorticis]
MLETLSKDGSYISSNKRTSPFRYAVGMLGTSIPINLLRTYAAIYCIDQIGITSTQFSMILFIYTIVDVLNIFWFGFLSDRTRTRWGRRKPWLIISTPLLVVSLICFFSGDAFENKLLLMCYLGGFYVLTTSLDLIINLNYGSLFPELFPENQMRIKTNVLRQAFQIAAMAISIALTPILTEHLGYFSVAVIYGILAWVIIWFCTFGCYENPERQKDPDFGLINSFLTIVKEKNLWFYGVSTAFYSISFSMFMQSMPFFIKYALHLGPSATSLIFFGVLTVTVIGMLFWGRVSSAISALNVLRTATIIIFIGFLLMAFSSSLSSLALFSCLIGFGISGVMASSDIVGANLIDRGYENHGKRLEGVYSSFFNLMYRVNGIFIGFAFFLVENLYHFSSGSSPGTVPDQASKFLFVFFPLAAIIVSLVMTFLISEGHKEQNR